MLLYALNIFFQGLGTSAVVKINSGWYAPIERGVFSGIFNVLLTSGYYMALGGCPVLIQSFGWPSVFLLPGVALILCCILMLCTLKENEYAANGVDATQTARKTERSSLIPAVPSDDSIEDGLPPAAFEVAPKKTSLSDLFKNKVFLCYLVAIMALCWVRDGLITWIYSFLENSRPVTADTSSLVGGAITLGGFVGGVLCGFVSDYIFRSDRNYPMLIFSAFQVRRRPMGGWHWHWHLTDG